MLDRVMDRVLSVLFPEVCPMCGDLVEGNSVLPLCAECYPLWNEAKRKCSLSNAGRLLILDHKCGISIGVHILTWYDPDDRDGIVPKMIYKLKEKITVHLYEFFAHELLSMLYYNDDSLVWNGSNAKNTVVTFIPRRKAAKIEYGYDHMKLVADSFAKQGGIECAEVIFRASDSPEQKKLGHRERYENAMNSLFVCNPEKIAGKTVVLIDDIVTTGASLCAAVNLLLKSGAKEVIPIAIAGNRRKRKKNKKHKPRGKLYDRIIDRVAKGIISHFG